MTKKHCEHCGSQMQRWGHTKAGTLRFFCTACKKSGVRKRKDVEEHHLIKELQGWLGGKASLRELAKESRVTRQTLSREFHPLFNTVTEPHIPPGTKPRILIVDATYIHSHSPCALVAIDENDHIYWRFAPYESYKYWLEFLASFREPEIIIMDGQKGLFAAAKTLWSDVPIQRCQFHVIAFALQYLGRKPKEEVGKELIDILYRLKDAKTLAERDCWIFLYKMWEKKWEIILSSKNAYGNFQYPRLRSTRLIIRRALPNLFTFLDHVDAPNTTNLVEGWVNSAIAEALRMHRGLRVYEKKALVSILLSKLKRQKSMQMEKTLPAEILKIPLQLS
ncbi:MAG: family transposase [Candidatus Taylorbacteria bacterium]|nr:family transposase [Candidatus Taylorbacteria bacterium]